ncbi:MAG: dihydropteroate synthase [Aestuariivita sp.]|uniref:dihydropteroate synthase n=1 Tax=Aestuariivita sp. TaxID=1872407 RepID=UPI003BAE7568
MIYRPLVQSGHARPLGAVSLAGGALWFTHAEALSRGAAPVIVEAGQIPGEMLDRLSAARAPIAGMRFERANLMGILNVTPDSFSDGGQNFDPADALVSARAMAEAGVDILDIGGESTRPGAQSVSASEEIRRTAPVIAAIRAQLGVALSIDTRKAEVAGAALVAGASLVNDVAGFTHDPALAPLCAAQGVPVCVMHAQGDPATMQDDPQYDDVVQDVYAFLAARIDDLSAAGIARDQIIVDPGIGFGKTIAHNLELLRNIAVFHGLGCPILLGASRKRFIGVIGNAPVAADRAPGSIAVGLAALAQGVQILRVHDVIETAQAVHLWNAAREMA